MKIVLLLLEGDTSTNALVQSMKVNGKEVSEMVTVSCNGKMVQNMKENGVLVELGAKVLSFMQEGKFMREIGGQIRHMVKESTITQMVHSIKDNGLLICSMAKEVKHGQTDRNLTVNILKAKRTGLVVTLGLMVQGMKECGKITRFAVMVTIAGPMEDVMWDTGKPTSWMSLGSTHGKMAECMKGSTRKIRSMVLEFTPGQIRSAMLVGGVTASSMDLVSSSQRRVARNLESGKMARSFDGSQTRRYL